MGACVCLTTRLSPPPPSHTPPPACWQVLYDIGAVSTPEPFQQLVSQGMILGEIEYSVYRNEAGAYCPDGTPGAQAVRCVAGRRGRGGAGEAARTPYRFIGCTCGGGGDAPGTPPSHTPTRALRIEASEVEPTPGGGYVLKADPSVKVCAGPQSPRHACGMPAAATCSGDPSRLCPIPTPPARRAGHLARAQDEQEPRQRGQPGRRGVAVRRRLAAPVRNVHGAAARHKGVCRGLRALPHASRSGAAQCRAPPPASPLPLHVRRCCCWTPPRTASPPSGRAGVVHQGRGGGAPLPGARVPPCD